LVEAVVEAFSVFLTAFLPVFFSVVRVVVAEAGVVSRETGVS